MTDRTMNRAKGVTLWCLALGSIWGCALIGFGERRPDGSAANPGPRAFSLAAATAPESQSSSVSNQTGDGSGGRAVVHGAGGRQIRSKRLQASAPDARLYRTGHDAAEPTLGVTKQGWILYQGLTGRRPLEGFPRYGDPDVLRSKDRGRTWEIVSPAAGSQKRHVASFDPYLYVDPVTSRIFTADLTPAVSCSKLSFSDDGGDTWTTSPVCGQFDHQTVFSGPPAISKTAGYPNVVYFCAVDGGLGALSTVTSCSKSLNGGLSFSRTGSPAYVTDPLPEEGDTLCNGATGHGFVGPDGAVYLPRGWCGEPWLAISHDEGATWARVQVAGNGMPVDPDFGGWAHEAGVVVDGDGNVYYAWVATDRLPYLAISRDGGKTWGEPMMIGPPRLTRASLPGIALGGDGKIAVVYMGTESVVGEPATWNGYITMTANALRGQPIFYTGSINDPQDPLIVGDCGPTRCEAEFDFIDIVIDPDGTPWAALVDGCTEVRCESDSGMHGPSEGVVGSLVGGPGLR